MKKILTLMAVIALVLSSASCSDDDTVKLSNLTVTLTTPTEVEGFSIDASVEGIPVTLTNTTDNTETTLNTDAAGTAIFENVAAGSYSISASTNLEIGVNNINLIASSTASILAGIDKELTLPLVGSVKQNDLIISEIYTSTPEFVGLSYLQSKFIEVYNNTDETLTTEGLILATIAGRSGNDGDRTWSASLPIGEKIYASNVLRFPQDNIKSIAPGEGIVIALNAIDYTDGLPADKDATKFADLSNSDFECYSTDYLQGLGFTGSMFFDSDNSEVANMDILYMYNQGNNAFVNFSSSGEAYVLYRDANFAITDDSYVEEAEDTADPKTRYVTLESQYVIDGVCVLANSSAAAYQSLPSTIDASFTYCKEDGGAMNSGVTLIRKKDASASTDSKVVLIDTNNSASDFTQSENPTPHVYGE